MYDLLGRSERNVIGVRVTGTLTSSDYEELRPKLEQRTREHGPLRVLILMEDWHGWDSLMALWEDLKTDVRLNEHVERLAMVGEEDWEQWMTEISKPFARGTLRYFDVDELEEAWSWVRG